MSERIPASFRDPAGFMFRREGVLYRQINDRHTDSYKELLKSGLYDELVRRRLLIPHVEVQVSPAEPDMSSLVIRPDPVRFISYPFEWCPGQLRAAAEGTLEIQRLAIEHGMSLRDASAYNIQFHEGRATLIDTLSFEPLPDGKPWFAYGQFCRHFLAPLALMKFVDVRLVKLLRTELDGIPLDLAASLLPWRTRLQWGLGVHLHAHASSQRRHAGSDPGRTPAKGRRLSRQALVSLIESLLAAVKKQYWEPASSAWRDYYALRESYSGAAMEGKVELVTRVLRDLPAETVWDLGANTGQFSRLAAEVTGAHVVSIEMDASAVELSWRDCRAAEDARVLPLLNDLSNPTPAQGWAHAERESLLGRGPADVVLALALVHHLAIGNNVPLLSLLHWLASAGRTVVIEWVPKEDPMVQRLLSTREDVFADYDMNSFEDAAREHFEIKSKEQVPGSLRSLYVLERHG